MSNKKKITLEIDFDTGMVEDVKAQSSGYTKGKKLTQAELNKLLAGPHTEMGKLVFTHSSPGCVTYYIGGNAWTVCY